MKKKLWMDHDGAIDDLLSQLLVLTMPDVDLIGLSITPADCFLEPALESAYKLLHLMDRTEVPMGRGESYGVNAFPDAWRARPECVNALPMLINLPSPPDPYQYPSAPDLMIDTLRASDTPVTVLMTGPCSNLTLALERAPDLVEKIDEVIWMAGAFRTQGNVLAFQHNGTAEWNVYWDPVSAQKLLTYGLPLVFVALDATNHVPVHKTFLQQLARQADHRLSNLAGQLWALTIDTIPSYHYTYFMWDMLATSYLALPQAFTTEAIRATISTRPPNAGQTRLDPNGVPATLVTDVDKALFYDYLLQQFRA
ncbi:purine nucleosidase [Catalinimonas alkaloidigena]|uniref:Purine nucleosidase n=1 Tax=Catalinimonas alkaloidigena TaxID=1075417 RepID=A0A1G9UNE9_9BACT|nr:nucleoside hydrolase [Catalinimonas alkaloidigena]SDM61406.1 purine nucleosidase [Catalinimonas alkaloidigena]